MKINLRKSKLLSLALIVLFALNTLSVTAFALDADGTISNPYVISSAEQLLELSKLGTVGYVSLDSDIDMSEISGVNHIIDELDGVFYGNGHKISNLSLEGGKGSSKYSDGEFVTNYVDTALIGKLKGTVCDLVLDNYSVTGNIDNYNCVGSVAAEIPVGSAAKIDNCIVNGTINGSTYASNTFIGAFVGRTDGSVDNNTELTINNCVSNVSLTGGKSNYVGGLIGSAQNISTIVISNNAIIGNFSGSSHTAGGLIGYINSYKVALDISNTYLGSEVTGSKKFGVAYNLMAPETVKCSEFYYDSEKNPGSSWSPFDMLNKGSASITATAKTTAEIKALGLESFEVRSGEFDDYPVPVWTPSELPEPPEPSFSCSIKFEGTKDGTVTLYKDDISNTIESENGIYTLGEKGEYFYTVTDFSDYEDITDGKFTVGDSDNETTKTIWVHPVYKTVEPDGSGSAENPYVIKKASELCTLSKHIANGEKSDSYIVLENDITVNDSWTPLGLNAAFPFKGTFDGCGYSVTVTVDNPKLSYFGFFGCLEDANIKNLTVNGEIYCSEPGCFAGGIAARARGNTVIENCINNASVSSLARSYASIGGIVGGYDDNVEYRWEDICLKIINCENNGIILTTGSDLNTFTGGIVGSNKNCVQLDSCANNATIYSPGTYVGGLLGQAGSRMGEYAPLIKDCSVNAALVGKKSKTFRLYGSGSLSASSIVNSGSNDYIDEAEITDSLLAEANKYADIIAVPSSCKVGETITFIKDGEYADSDISVSCSRGEADISKGYIEYSVFETTLAKPNKTGKIITETATIRLSNTDGKSIRKPVTINIYPSESDGETSARRTLMNTIANGYKGKSDDWTVFDMAVYERLGFGDNTTDTENYLNLTVNELSGNTALVTDRAKAEIIFAALGTDSKNLTALGDEKSFNNAEKLQTSNLGNSHYSAPWILLAEDAGNVELTDSQREKMIKLLIDAQGENGLFYSTWGGEKYDDVDTTGTALAALARFEGNNDDVDLFIEKALEGLSMVQGSDASFGNINSDAMVITGLAALGIDIKSDKRFIKNKSTLADAIMLYVNDSKTGFAYGYSDGEKGEKAQALATEQGFRALITLEQLEKSESFNVYTLKSKDGEHAASQIESKPFESNGSGTVELPEDVTIDDGGSGAKSNISVVLSVISDNETEWLSKSVTMPSGATAANLLKKAFADAGITAVGINNGYIKSVTKGNVTLAQFDKGPNSGWLYKVNDKAPNVAITDFKLKDGDSLVLYYTNDYTTDDSIKWSGSSGGSSSSSNVTVKFNTNGASEIKSITAAKDTTISKPDDPVRDGYTFAGWYTNEELTTKFDFSAKVTSSITLYAKWDKNDESQNGDTTDFANPYSDVINSSWYYVYVVYAAKNNIMNGVSDTEFAPDMNLTRAMFVTVLYRADASPKAGKTLFTDISDDAWYADSVSWAAKNKIVNGVSDTEFAPDMNITREQAATILMRYAQYKGEDISSGDNFDISSFTDSSSISQYATSAIRYAVSKGYINGKGESLICPTDNITRAEAAALIMRFCEK